jgi:hypothetical protein
MDMLLEMVRAAAAAVGDDEKASRADVLLLAVVSSWSVVTMDDGEASGLFLVPAVG